MQFNLDPDKQAQEVYFWKIFYPVSFNNKKILTCFTQNHIGLLLVHRPSFNEHIQSKINKYYTMIRVITKLSVNLHLKVLLRIYKSFVRPHLDYGNIYDKPNNESFQKNIENVQYKACIAITGAIKGTFWKRLYYELGLESLGDRRWSRKLIFFYKIVIGLALKYVANYLNTNDNPVYKREASECDIIKRLGTKTENVKHFFSFFVKEWYKLDISMRKAEENVKSFKSLWKDFFRFEIEIITCYSWYSRCYVIITVTVEVYLSEST